MKGPLLEAHQMNSTIQANSQVDCDGMGHQQVHKEVNRSGLEPKQRTP